METHVITLADHHLHVTIDSEAYVRAWRLPLDVIPWMRDAEAEPDFEGPELPGATPEEVAAIAAVL